MDRLASIAQERDFATRAQLLAQLSPNEALTHVRELAHSFNTHHDRLKRFYVAHCFTYRSPITYRIEVLICAQVCGRIALDYWDESTGDDVSGGMKPYHILIEDVVSKEQLNAYKTVLLHSIYSFEHLFQDVAESKLWFHVLRNTKYSTHKYASKVIKDRFGFEEHLWEDLASRATDYKRTVLELAITKGFFQEDYRVRMIVCKDVP